MEKKTYEVNGLPRGGPYSHAVEAGGFVFVSGTVPIEFQTQRTLRDDVKEATRVVLENIQRILQEAGCSLGNVVKVTVFLRDMADFQAMNEVYSTFFPDQRPARSCVAVKELPGDFPIEIEVIAVK
jgi:2-iminobutanoate/2-iminopropanoate deaminase